MTTTYCGFCIFCVFAYCLFLKATNVLANLYVLDPEIRTGGARNMDGVDRMDFVDNGED